MMNSRVVMEQFLDGEQFYELMQAYRHTPSHEQQAVLAAFELVKSEIILAALAAAAVPSSPAQACQREIIRSADDSATYLSVKCTCGKCLPPSSPVADPQQPPTPEQSICIAESVRVEPTYHCERCQMKLPERLMTFGIGVRGGDAAWCAACKLQPGEEGAAKRAEVIALRKAAWVAPGVTKQENP